jgi:catechol 2,3-dioxygenase-like lactoylglutathione lyase family enzyme
MLKIAVFGFYGPDQTRISPPGHEQHLSPVTTEGFMQHVWGMEPPESRIGSAPETLRFVKLTKVTRQPVYVLAVSDRLAHSAGLLNCDGYIPIVDAVKILAPRAIQSALRRLHALRPTADVIIAAARQNEPDALSSDEIRAILGLSPSLPVMPYVPTEPETVHRLIRRMVRYVDNPDRVPPPIFEGDALPVAAEPAPAGEVAAPGAAPASPAPHIHGLDHVAITVSDLDRALAFYRGLLGFRLLGHLDFPNDPRGLSIAYLDTGRGILELFSFTAARTHPPGGQPDDTQLGLRHFALRVTGLDAITGALRRADVPFTLLPTEATGGVRIAFFTDPDGTLIELIEGRVTYSRR